MNDQELRAKAMELIEKARALRHPLLPEPIKHQITGAALLLGEVVRRLTDGRK